MAAPSPSPEQSGEGPSILLDLLYLTAGVLLIPYFLYRRLIKGKQSAGLARKLGNVPPRDAKVPRVWIHAVSVGEATAAETLVKALKQRRPELDIVVSTTTVTGQSVAAKRYGDQNVFYYPLDLSWTVRRALENVRPGVLVLMELEVWPNMTAEARRRGIPVLVVNGRITERSAARYRRFWFLVGASFRRVTKWLVQSDEYSARLKELGVAPEKLEITGNMKYDAVDTAPVNVEERRRVRAELGIAEDALVMIGGSTHPSEEATLLSAYAELRKSSCPGLRLILVPRHPERVKAVAAEIAAAGFAVLRRSEMKAGPLDPSARRGDKGSALTSTVLLIDTVGELKNMYKAADVAFIGGSLIPHGGQNVMEPAGLGVPVIHGPHMHNFNDAIAILRGCNGSVETTREALRTELDKLLQDRPAATAMAERARAAFLKEKGATERAVNDIVAMLK